MTEEELLATNMRRDIGVCDGEEAKRETAEENHRPEIVVCVLLTDTGLGGSSHDAACASLLSARSTTVLASWGGGGETGFRHGL